jgi:hypothetical protein
MPSLLDQFRIFHVGCYRVIGYGAFMVSPFRRSCNIILGYESRLCCGFDSIWRSLSSAVATPNVRHPIMFDSTRMEWRSADWISLMLHGVPIGVPLLWVSLLSVIRYLRYTQRGRMRECGSSIDLREDVVYWAVQRSSVVLDIPMASISWIWFCAITYWHVIRRA